MLRSILAVIVGFVLAMVLAFGTDALLVLALPGTFSPDRPTPTAFLILILGYVFFYSVVGGYVTAVVAGRAEMKHSLALGVILMALGIVSVLWAVLIPADASHAGEQPPLWWAVCCIALALPGPVA